uniref:FliM/FliN family flagellar motor switch protein n=1 Tax=uncultured Sphingomonas sp. TaxID=158754 RepID=UPI0025EA8DEB|nr:FliM/FliN family flagellar motor switch protein [uncultured Sphingomonas sp.]
MVGLRSVHVQVAVVLGSTRLPIREILKMGRGTTIPLDGGADDLSELHANGLPIARGRMQVAGERLWLQVTELLAPAD